MDVLNTQVPWWRKAWDNNPLQVILIIALGVRLLAAFFSKGYAFHDDHFDVIRVAQDWVSGIPHWISDSTPPNHSMFYAGINALLIWIAEAVGITDPQVKMVFVRLIHAFYSVLIVYYGYKITEKLSGKKEAIIVGAMLSVLWFMPYLGVKNLVEMVCIPPLLIAFHKILQDKVTLKNWLLAGALIGIAFTLRYHTIIFAGGIGIIMLFRKQFVPAVVFSIGFLLAAFFIIGVIDMMFWEYPFQSVVSYFQFNAENAYNYSTGPIYRFFLTVVGFTVPPISLFLLWGYFKGWKISKEMWLAATLFFVIHSLFPNKQERFIIPFFPFYIIMGVIAWNQFISQSKFWSKNSGLLKGLWWFFWVINIVATLALALTYSKKDRIEPFSYLSKKNDVEAILIESSSNSIKFLPEFYLGKTAAVYGDMFSTYSGMSELRNEEELIVVFEKPAWKAMKDVRAEIDKIDKMPNYVIFKRDKDLEQRIDTVSSLFNGRKLVFEREIKPSFFDQLLHVLNPRVHKEEVNFIYKVVPNSKN